MICIIIWDGIFQGKYGDGILCCWVFEYVLTAIGMISFLLVRLLCTFSGPIHWVSGHLSSHHS